MKLVLPAISVSLVLCFPSGAVFAYSGSECEVNDCGSAKPAKANSNATKEQAKGSSATKAKPAALKDQAKDQAKEKLTEKATSQLQQGINGLFK